MNKIVYEDYEIIFLRNEYVMYTCIVDCFEISKKQLTKIYICCYGFIFKKKILFFYFFNTKCYLLFQTKIIVLE